VSDLVRGFLITSGLCVLAGLAAVLSVRLAGGRRSTPSPLPTRSAAPMTDPHPHPVNHDAARDLAHHLRAHRTSTVYDRIGGREAFREAVARLCDGILLDPNLSGPGQPFYGMLQDRRQRLEGHLRAMLTLIAGAEPTSQDALDAWATLATGVLPAAAYRKDIRAILRAAHRHLYLTDLHFSQVAVHLVAVLRGLAVEQEEIDALMANLLQYKDALVHDRGSNVSTGGDALL
jgi:truncated hemoglobin YjbI